MVDDSTEETVADMVTPEVGKEVVPGPPPTNADRAAAKEEDAPIDGDSSPDKKVDTDSTEEEADTSTEEPVELDTSVWGDTGSDVANSVLETLQNAGVTPSEAKALLWDAVEAGDPTKVDRDSLVEKVGKANATLIMAGITTVTNTNNTAIAEVTAIAHETAGSKDSWDKATKWARENMDSTELDELRSMIDKGGKAAKFATSELVSAYNADPKNTALSAGTKQILPDSKSNAAVKGISRLDYGKQMEILHQRRASKDEFSALRAQRNAGKAQGL